MDIHLITHYMHQHDPFELLAECSHGYIGFCLHCKTFSFAYKNIALHFDGAEMNQFFEWIFANRQNEEFQSLGSEGPKIVYPTPIHNLYLVFCDQELDDLNKMIVEAQLALEIRQILTPHRNY